MAEELSKCRIGRGTTLQAGLSIAYATVNHILKETKCRTLFATHLHELGELLGAPGDGVRGGIVDTAKLSPSPIESGRDGVEEGGKGSGVRRGVEFWCTDVDELVRRLHFQVTIPTVLDMGLRATNESELG